MKEADESLSSERSQRRKVEKDFTSMRAAIHEFRRRTERRSVTCSSVILSQAF
ncbi:MAG TPA: hypothetical protein VFW05_02680 [Verrucomicrobiae bacterium]|nr:hypothetical protein [Verrucomicrobiae bacterium]